ncbi:uncharacterized protein ACIB01_012605 [Guaruba guarouba]
MVPFGAPRVIVGGDDSAKEQPEPLWWPQNSPKPLILGLQDLGQRVMLERIPAQNLAQGGGRRGEGARCGAGRRSLLPSCVQSSRQPPPPLHVQVSAGERGARRCSSVFAHLLWSLRCAVSVCAFTAPKSSTAGGRIRVPAAAAAGEIRAHRGYGVTGQASESSRPAVHLSLGRAQRGASCPLAARRGKLYSARSGRVEVCRRRGGKKKKNAWQRWIKKRKRKKQDQKNSEEDASEEQAEEKQQSLGQGRSCSSQSRVPEKGRRREVEVLGEHHIEGMSLILVSEKFNCEKQSLGSGRPWSDTAVKQLFV